MGHKKIILLFGPTTSGKSKLAVDISKEYNGEIITAKGIKVGYLPQEPDLDDTKNVYENVCEGAIEKLSLVEKYNELSMNYSEDIADDLAKLQDEIEAKDLWDLDSKIEQAMNALRCPEKTKNINNLSQLNIEHFI